MVQISDPGEFQGVYNQVHCQLACIPHRDAWLCVYVRVYMCVSGYIKGITATCHSISTIIPAVSCDLEMIVDGRLLRNCSRTYPPAGVHFELLTSTLIALRMRTIKNRGRHLASSAV